MEMSVFHRMPNSKVSSIEMKCNKFHCLHRILRSVIDLTVYNKLYYGQTECYHSASKLTYIYIYIERERERERERELFALDNASWVIRARVTGNEQSK